MARCFTHLFFPHRLAGLLLTALIACSSVHAVSSTASASTKTATPAQKADSSLSAKERAIKERKRRICNVLIGCAVVTAVALIVLAKKKPRYYGSGGGSGTSGSYGSRYTYGGYPRDSWRNGNSYRSSGSSYPGWSGESDYDRRQRERRERWAREDEERNRRWREDRQRWQRENDDAWRRGYNQERQRQQERQREREQQEREQWRRFEEEFRRAWGDGGPRFGRGAGARGAYNPPPPPVDANEINRRHILRGAPGVLGVGSNATQAEVQRAYRRMAAQYHPDKNPGDEAAAQRMRDINNARDALEEEMRRNGQWN